MSFCAWYFLGVFSSYNYFSAQKDISNGKVKLIVYGEPALNPFLEKQITLKYGFQYENLGCITNYEKLHSAKIYNNVVLKYLDKRNGKDWKAKFDKDIQKIIEK
jgi:hypothetical protein